MIPIKDKKTLDFLDPGSVVYYRLQLTDGLIHYLAQKDDEGKWHVGDFVEGFSEVVLDPEHYPIHLVYWHGRVVGD